MDITPQDMVAQLSFRIELVQDQIASLRASLERLCKQRTELQASIFIEEHHITKDSVEMSGGKGKPYFGHIMSFVQWMKDHKCQKPWAEWNTRIYSTADLMSNRMPETPVCVDDLKE